MHATRWDALRPRRALLLWTALGLLIVLLAYSRWQAGSGPEVDLSRDALFAQLTATTWCSAIPDAPRGATPARTHYTLRRDGTDEWGRYSDAPEDSGAGQWNFEKTTPGGGVLLLDSGDVLRFALLRDGTLRLAAQPLNACQPQPDVDAPLSAGALPVVHPTALYERLTAHPWRKASDDIPYPTPTRVEFRRTGEYLAMFGDGNCSSLGFWSLRGDELTLEQPDGDCDPRIEGPTTFRGRVVARGTDYVDFYPYGLYGPAGSTRP
jgi:hypothetical protein